MSDSFVLVLLGGVAGMVWFAYAMSTLALDMLRKLMPDADRSVFVGIRMELKPFALPAMLVSYIPIMMSPDVGWPMRLSLLANLWIWWSTRHDPDDDDRWKKRRKKLTEQVSVIGGRLQVTPVRSS